MADIIMTQQEKNNINSILEIAKELPLEEQRKLYYIGIGLAYSGIKEKEDAKNSIN